MAGNDQATLAWLGESSRLLVILREKTPWGYINEEKISLQLILLIEVEDIWRLLLYDSVLG